MDEGQVEWETAPLSQRVNWADDHKNACFIGRLAAV